MIHIKRIDEMAIKRDIIADYDEIEPFDSEHIKVYKDGLYNIMDNNGNLLSDVWFDKIEKKSSGGFDIEFTDKNNKTHTGQYLDMPELKKNIEIKNLVKHTDMLELIDFSDIILVEPYILKRPNMKRGVKIIANVTYMSESLFLGVDGKLYNQNGSLYEMAQFSISQVDIKRLTKIMDELNVIMNPAYNPRTKGETSIHAAYNSGKCVFAFGFNTNNIDVNYSFNTSRKNTIKQTNAKPWGKRSMNSIKVRFTPFTNVELREILDNEYDYSSYVIDKWKGDEFNWDAVTTTKEYLPTELDEMFAELNRIKADIERIYKTQK